MAALDKRLRQGEEWFARAQDLMSKRPRPASPNKKTDDDVKDAA